MNEMVVVLGASSNPERFSNKAIKMLKRYGHTPVPVNPGQDMIEGIETFKSLSDIHFPIETLTMYVGAKTSTPLLNEILELKPKRVIFNPGSENPSLYEDLRKEGVEIIEDCTLMMLEGNRF